MMYHVYPCIQHSKHASVCLPHSKIKEREARIMVAVACVCNNLSGARTYPQYWWPSEAHAYRVSDRQTSGKIGEMRPRKAGNGPKMDEHGVKTGENRWKLGENS